MKVSNLKAGLFHTPETYQEIHDWIEKHPPEQRISLYTVMGMTLNMTVKVLKNDGLDDVVFIPDQDR